MLVDTPLSSRNTRLVDSMKRCHTCQRRRCRATSGRSCSAALKAFFIGDLEPMEHIGDGRQRLHADPALMERVAHLSERDPGFALRNLSQCVRMWLEDHPTIATNLRRSCASR